MPKPKAWKPKSVLRKITSLFKNPLKDKPEELAALRERQQRLKQMLEKRGKESKRNNQKQHKHISRLF